MDDPQKPFACSVAECGMTFTNEDHLHVHSKKHDMVLQLGLEQKAAFVADQTPTPTRFIRNCEEVGLFQDLQHVAENPFDEGFKKAMETKQGILCLENVIAGSADDVLHTPQMVFTLDSGDSTLFSTGQRLISISRSSSDDPGAVKSSGTTISRLSNEIKISRMISRDVPDKITIEDNTVVKNTENVENSSVNETIYTKNVIKTVIKDGTTMVVETKDVLLTDMNKLQVPEKQQIMSQKSLDYVVDSLTSEINHETETIKVRDSETIVPSTERKLVYLNEDMNKTFCKLQPPVQMVKIVPNMTSKLIPKPPKLKRTIIDFNKLPKLEPKPQTEYDSHDIEVMIKLPNGKRVKMKAVDDESKPDYKEIIKNKLINKKNISRPKFDDHESVPAPAQKSSARTTNAILMDEPHLPNAQVVSIKTKVANEGDKTPVSNIKRVTNAPIIITNEGHLIIPEPSPCIKPVKTISDNNNEKISQPTEIRIKKEIPEHRSHKKIVTKDKINERLKTTQITENNSLQNIKMDVSEEKKKREKSGNTKRSKSELEFRSAASKRYRDRLKQQMLDHQSEIQALREANQRLMSEKAVLKLLITEHMKKCPNAEEFRITQARIQDNGGF